MSESSDQDGQRAKKRARKRSCDVCRSKKIRCDGPEKKSHEKCSSCTELGVACTYVETAKRRGPPKGYVDQLEHRMLRLEATLKRLHPETDFLATVGPALDKDTFDLGSHLASLQGLHIPPLPALNLPKTSVSSTRGWLQSPNSVLGSPTASASASTPPSSNRLHSLALDATAWTAREADPHRRTPSSKNSLRGQATPPGAIPSDSDENDTLEQVKMVEDFARLQTEAEHKEDHYRFHGKSSGVQLVQAVRDLKTKAAGGADGFVEGLATSRRREYWTIPAWEIGIANESVTPPDFALWPEPDLAELLIDAYFRHCNLEYPLLNRIMFKRQYRENLWRHHMDFAKVTLMVFANGARYVDDSRAYFKNPDAPNNHEDLDGSAKHSAGWRYMQMVIKMGKSWLSKPGLHDLQAHVLFCTFMQGSAIPHMTWLIAGMGLRLSQDMGIHLRAGMSHLSLTEKALHSRAFWCLYHIDRISAAAIGRAVAMQDSDFDAEFPLAVDDEYWDTGNPETTFVQPEDKTAKIASFICVLRLDHIIECALKTVYAVGKTNISARSQDPEDQKAIVVELDSALNAWADAVPDSLRWDPARRDMETFERSAILYVQYYFVQILVHRPFIPTPRRPTTTGFPSLAICSSASRSIANIVDVVLKRSRQLSSQPGRGVPQALLMPAFTAAVVLLIGVWSGRKPGSSCESERAMLDIKKCLRGMKDMETTWRQAGKMADILTELASATNMPVATPPSASGQSSGSSLKRTREDGRERGEHAEGNKSNPSANTNLMPLASSQSYLSPSSFMHVTGPSLQQQSNAPVFSDTPSFPFSFSTAAANAAQPAGMPANESNEINYDSPFVNGLLSSLNYENFPNYTDMETSSLLHGYGGAELASFDLLPQNMSPRPTGQSFSWPGIFDLPNNAQQGIGQTLEGWSAFGLNDNAMNNWEFSQEPQRQ